MATILAIHAHPGRRGTPGRRYVALLAGLGHAITIATFTPGDCGSKDLGAEEIAPCAARKRPMRRRSSAPGTFAWRCATWRFRRRRIAPPRHRNLRQTRPDLVLTASPWIITVTTKAASALVRDACFGAPAPNYATGARRRRHRSKPSRNCTS